MPQYRHETIHQLLVTQSQLQGERPAISDGEGLAISYARLRQLVDGLVADFTKAGVEPGDRVSLVMPNGVEMAVALLAVSSFATAVPLNPAYKADEFRSYFKDLRVRWLLVPEDEPHAAMEVAEEMGIGVLLLAGDGTFRIAGGHPRKKAAVGRPASKADDACLILLTSGSTGRSKKVPLTHRQVLRSTADICETLHLTSEDVCLCMWEQFHIGGLVDLLLVPLASGGRVVCAGSFSAPDLCRLMVPEDISWFQAVPTTLHELMLHLRTQGIRMAAPRLRFIRAVASALSPSMMADVETVFGVPVVQTFGMTEAGPLISTNRLPPGKRKPGSVGTSCGPEIRIQDAEGRDLPVGTRGEIVVRGENVITAYEDAPEANQVSFRDGWFRTGDTGYFDDENYLYLTGRIKEMINRGGEKITPQEIDDVLQAHPGIAQAASFSVSHPVLGEDVAVAVVLKPGHTLTANEIRHYAGQRLASFKVPQRVVMLDAMPRDPVGKINRLTLATLAQSAKAESKPGAAAPQAAGGIAEIEARVAAIWARELNVPEVQPDDNFFALGGHSLAGVRVFLAIESEFGRQLSPDVWGSITTVRELSALIARELKPESASSPAAKAVETPAPAPLAREASALPEQDLRTIQLVMNSGQIKTLPHFPTIKALNPNGDRSPLFWVFNSPDREMAGLQAHWDAEQPLFGLFSGSKNLPRTTEAIDQLARHYADCIVRLCPRGNFHLGGNCRGGKVALRILQILNEKKVLPRRIIFMEHCDKSLLNYPGHLLLLFGRHSRARAYEMIDIKAVLAGKFPRVSMRWINGQHGEFFTPMNSQLLARRLLAFLRGDNRPQEFLEGLRAKLTWRAHASETRFARLVESYQRQKKRYAKNNGKKAVAG